jgi:hypothetical protein
MKWIVEKNIFDEDCVNRLEQEIISNNDELYHVEYIPFERGDYSDLPLDERCIFYGSLNLAKQFQNQHPSVNVFCTLPNYKCSKYYAYLGKWLLNADYTLLPFAELFRREDELYDVFGQDDAVFIRPDDGDKKFTGQIVYKENFVEQCTEFQMKEKRLKEYDLVLVSSPKNILREWRLVICNSWIIAGSLYHDTTMNLDYMGYPQEVEDLAKDIIFAANYKPDEVYVMDFCETQSGKFYLLEIGGFSCAGLYECDMGDIVREVSYAVDFLFK